MLGCLMQCDGGRIDNGSGTLVVVGAVMAVGAVVEMVIEIVVAVIGVAVDGMW